MLTKDDLMKFVNPDENWHRHHIDKPWSRDGFTYATNGHIIIRVPLLPDVPEDKEAPGTDFLFKKVPIPDTWLPIPELPEPIFEVCDLCGGAEKYWDRSEKKWEPCDCHGEQIEKMVEIKVGEITYQAQYLRLLDGLQKCVMAPTTDDDPAWFKFDGGTGFLMPMKV